MTKNMKKIGIIILTLLLCFATISGCSIIGHPEGEHTYVSKVVAPTCIDGGYTRYTCSCGDFYDEDQVPALGHDFTNYVSNNDATTTKDGTKTAICNREGCDVTDTITDVGSMLGSKISFKTLSTTGQNKVAFSQKNFNFDQEITVAGYATYTVYKNQQKTQKIENTQSVSLSTGLNTFYVVETVPNKADVTYKIEIYRNKRFQVKFNLAGGENGGIGDVMVEEGTLIKDVKPIPTRAGYNFMGWDVDGNTPLTENLILTAKWMALTDRIYKVEYYLPIEGSDDYELADTETLAGTTGQEVSATEKYYAGYNVNVEKSTLSGVIAGDGSLVLKVYYKLGNAVTFNLNGGTGDEQAFKTQYVTDGYLATEPTAIPTKFGYDFAGWDFDFDTKITANTNIVAIWTARTDTSYKVEYYLPIEGSDDYELADTETLAGTTGQEVSATEKYYAGYNVNVEKSTLSGVIAGDGSLVLKVYYKLGYAVKFDLNGGTGDEEAFKTQYVTDGYWATEPTAIPTKFGYDFAGWNFDFRTPVTTTLTITAKWTAMECAYTVKYYKPVGEVTNLKIAEPQGFMANASAPAAEASWIIFDYYPVNNGLRGGNPENAFHMSVTNNGEFASNRMPIYTGNYVTTAEHVRVLINIKTGEAYRERNGEAVSITTFELTTLEEGQYYTVTMLFNGFESQGSVPAGDVAHLVLNNVKVYDDLGNDLGVKTSGSWIVLTEDDYELADTERLAGTFGQEVSATEKYYPGYNVDVEKSILSGEIAGDGSLVLKVYYKLGYAVTFNLNGGTGDEEAFKTQYVTDGYLATEPTAIPTKFGYDFAGWNFDFSTPVKGATVVKAMWNEAYCDYTVEYYLDDKLEETDELEGLRDVEVKAVVKYFSGYEYIEDQGVLSGIVTEDGSLTLKVYYKKVVMNQPTDWTTYNFSDKTYTASTKTNLTISSFTVSNVNKYKLVYNLDEPVKCYLTFTSGSIWNKTTHTEDFFLEAGQNVTFTSFTDDVLGDRQHLIDSRSVIHNSPYVAGSPIQEKVTAGKTFSGTVSISFEPIQSVTVNFKPISFSTTYQQIDEKVVYISNERFKVGTHLYYGGALTYFEDLQDGRADIGNLVNIHDGGRLIQQSYYSTDVAANGGVAYNPVQGGNGSGFSKIIDFSVTENCIYIKARAKNWLDHTDTGLSSSYMENWYTLTEDYLIVDNSFVDFLDSNNNDAGNELPAVYFVGALNQLVFYTGRNHWQDDTLSYFELENLLLENNGGKGHSMFEDGESWGAWLNAEGWGCGVYTPNVRGFAGWFAGDHTDETYNPYKYPTSYLRFSKSYPIRPFEKVRYTYIMTTGTIDEIRGTFKENRNYDVNEFPESYADQYDMTNFDFSIPQTQGFTQHASQVFYDTDLSRGVLKVSPMGSDPYFGITLLGTENRPLTSDYEYVAVEYMVPKEYADYLNGSVAQIYVGVNDQQSITGSQVKTFNLIADGKWHIGYVYFGDCDWYIGTVNYIRYDPCAGSSPIGTEYYIKSIKLLKDKPVDPNSEDDYEPTQKTQLQIGKDSPGQVYFAMDYKYSTSDGYSYVTGWILYKGGIRRFEYLIYEVGSIGSDEEAYLKSAESEYYWRIAPRTITSTRNDASDAYPGVQGDGSNAGYTICMPNKFLEEGKTYKVAIRAITHQNEACLLDILDYPLPLKES